MTTKNKFACVTFLVTLGWNKNMKIMNNIMLEGLISICVYTFICTSMTRRNLWGILLSVKANHIVHYVYLEHNKMLLV